MSEFMMDKSPPVRGAIGYTTRLPWGVTVQLNINPNLYYQIS